MILSNQTVLALTVYNFTATTSDEQAADQIQQIIAEQPFLQQTYESVHIIYSYSTSILVPQEFFHSADHQAMLELVYGPSNNRIIRFDDMQAHSIHTIYGIPSAIDEVVTRFFGNALQKHFFSFFPDFVTGNDNCMHCIFSAGELKVLVKKAGKLQAIQIFSFKTPEDASYYLLNLCQSFELNINNTELRLSGMITENAALYTELNKYFLQIRFEALPGAFQYPQEMNDYPSHYFSHLLSIAACV
jgi:hypothetical protein